MPAIAASLLLFLAILTGSLAFFRPAGSGPKALEERIRFLRAGDSAGGVSGASAPARASSRSVVPELRRLLSGGAWGEATALELRQANLPMRVSELLAVRLLLAALFFVVAALLLSFQPVGLLVGLGTGLLGYLISGLCLRALQRRRAAKLEKQLVEFLPMLASSLRSGFGLQQGIEAATRQLGPPLAEELSLLLHDVGLGASMQTALEDLGWRVGNPDLDIIITAILVQRTTGGNLAEVLDKAGETLLERERVRGELQTLTAQQRLTGTVLSVYPVVVGLVLLAIMPAMWTKLFTEPVGQIQLVIAAGLQLVGFIAIRRALRIEY